MRTNAVPYSDQPPGATPNNTRVGNYFNNDELANNYNDGYAVSGTAALLTSQNYLTDVGAYTSSPSFYGTFDQNGNVYEWTDTVAGQTRLLHGGSWNYSSTYMLASTSFNDFPTGEHSIIGFRVASVVIPEPSSLLLALLAFGGSPTRRRKSVPYNRV